MLNPIEKYIQKNMPSIEKNIKNTEHIKIKYVYCICYK